MNKRVVTYPEDWDQIEITPPTKVVKYSEDQERDDHGRFTSGGSSGQPIPSHAELMSMKTVPGPLGSQGGTWKQAKDGTKYLMKPLQDLKHGMNEIAAGAVYHEAGIKFPNTGVVEGPNGHYLVSQKIEGLGEKSKSEWKSSPDLQAKAAQGFGVDALLSHWDVHGLAADNTLVDKAGDPVRIESGGAMAYRAMGGNKSSFAAGQEWAEPSSMRTSNQGRAMYGNMSNEQAAQSLEVAGRINLDNVQARWDAMGVPRSMSDPWKATLADRQAQIPGIVAALRGSKKSMTDNVVGMNTSLKNAANTIYKARIALLHKAGNAEALIDWYNSGADGQIDWGSEGDFDACVAIAGEHLDNPEGFCQLRHIDATGEPAGKASGEAADKSAVAAIKKARALLKYSDDQPRDDNGRFASGGGSGSGPKEGSAENNGEPKSIISGGKTYTFDKNTTLYSHLVSDGEGGWMLDPERQALHDKIVDHFTKGVPVSSDPTMHMLGGGPAAGKSTATNDPRIGIPQTQNPDGSLDKTNAVLVNADECKAQIPEYKDMTANGVKEAASLAHEESSMLSGEVLNRAISNGQNVVLDGTGNSKVASVLDKINGAREAGYKVIGTYVTCPTKDAVGRMLARGAATGRYVDKSIVESTHASVSRIFPDVASSFDKIRLIDTTGTSKEDAARVIAEGTRETGLIVHDPAAYQTFLDKAKEGK